MNTSTITQVVVIVIAVLILGYGVVRSFGSASDTENKVLELTPETEKVEINTSILDSPDIKKAESLKRFGATLTPNAGNLNRANPFEGI